MNTYNKEQVRLDKTIPMTRTPASSRWKNGETCPPLNVRTYGQSGKLELAGAHYLLKSLLMNKMSITMGSTLMDERDDGARSVRCWKLHSACCVAWPSRVCSSCDLYCPFVITQITAVEPGRNSVTPCFSLCSHLHASLLRFRHSCCV